MSLFTEISENLPFTKDGLWTTPSSDVSLRKKKYAQGGSGLGHQVLMSSVGASPARISASQERDLALPASAAAYGRSTPELLASYDPATSLWKTSQLCLDGELSEFSETWPRSGFQVAGTVSLPLPSGHRIVETESGS
jgi:hypothetical protein